jgi:WD40 repeat protein
LSLHLRFDTGGTDNFVRALQFSPDGNTLYSAGWNKVVQVFQFDLQTNQFHYEPRQNYRVPIGQGRYGMLECMVVSGDGRWLAAAGAVWSGGQGMVAPYVWPRGDEADEVLTEVGAIYVFDTRTRACRVLRGHLGSVRQLTFVEGDDDHDKLVSVGFECSGEQISQSVAVWSLATGQMIGKRLPLPRVILPPSTDISPRVRAWRSPATGLHVAVAAWRIESGIPVSDLVIWDPLSDETTRPLRGSPVAFAIESYEQQDQRQLYCGGLGEACTFSVTNPRGIARRPVAGGTAANIPFVAVRLPASPPRPGVAVSSGSSPRLAVVSIQRRASGDKDYSLSVVSANRSRRIGRLWVNRGKAGQSGAIIIEPAIAASADGRFLAIAGTEENGVRIFSPAELQTLRQPDAELRPMQVLSSQTRIPTRAAFVERDGKVGIAIGETAQAPDLSQLPHDAPLPAGLLILDAANRTVSDNTTGWKIAKADAGNWQSEISDDRLQIEVVNTSSGAQRALELPSEFRAAQTRYEVTTHAICRSLGNNPPLVAVASHVQEEPLLHLYDAETGELLRMLEGHNSRITDLAFSKDGELLLSTSLDRTVRGWLLQDIAKLTKGQVGWLKGLVLTSRDKQVVVDLVAADSQALRAGIQKGDQIAGVLTGSGLKTFKTASEFYLHVSQTAPETNPQITIRVRRQNRLFDIVLAVQQGADNRQPLFSILLSNPDDAVPGSHQEWLAWSPLGPFDFVGQKLEQRLGWHINTANDAEPVSFASVDQYRDRFYHEGLLAQLMTGRHIAQRPAAVPSIRLSLVTDDGQIQFPNYDDELVLRQPGGRLVLEFADQTGELVHNAEWSLPGQPAVSFTPIERDLWKSATPASDVGRGEHVVRVQVTTTDEPPLTFTQSVLLRYQPVAPELTLIAPLQTVGTVDTDRLPLRVSVNVAVPTTVTVVHEFGNGENQHALAFEASGLLEQDIILEPGRNVLRIVAANDNIPATLARFRSLEESRLETSVNYVPAGPPVITINRIVDTVSGSELELVDGKLLTDNPQVTLEGSITGETQLQAAGLVLAGQQSALEGFEPLTNQEFTFAQDILLEPGPQQMTVQASAGGEIAEVQVDAVFRPRLPTLTMISPREPKVVQIARQPQTELQLVSQLHADLDYPFVSAIFVDGVRQDKSTLSLDPDTGILTGNLQLNADAARETDEHRIELRISNEWGQQFGQPLTVKLLHPPVLLSAEVRRPATSAMADLICRVNTGGPRLVTAMQVQINGEDIPAADFTAEKAEAGLWNITVPKLPLSEGENRIQVVAENRDGSSDDISLTEVVLPPPQKAELKLVSPLGNHKTMQPQQQIAFAVRSETALQRVDLVVDRDHRLPQRISLLKESELTAGTADRVFEHSLALTTGINRVQITVQNAGGATSRQLEITYLPPPVSIQLTELTAVDGTWAAAVIEPAGSRIAFAGPADNGRAILRGKIGWLPDHRPKGEKWTIRVWVNGFLRSLSIAAPDDESEEALFAIPIVLNQAENRLRLEAPEISFGNRRLALADYWISALGNIMVRCRQPEQHQRLHLVMMGVEMQDGENVSRADELKEFATYALGLEAQSTAFAEIKSYAPLVGEKAIGRNLRTLMVLVETEISQRRTSGRINDVVMFYYRGREHRGRNGGFVLEDFQNYDNPAQHPQSVSESYLATLFEHLPGAHVVFLDVLNSEHGPATASRWPQFPNLGLFRIAWSGEQPVPLPPGPLLSAVHGAAAARTDKGILKLASLERAFHDQLGSAKPIGRFLVETYVPDDLADLVLSRLTADGESSEKQP